jgi:hypothetical protein
MWLGKVLLATESTEATEKKEAIWLVMFVALKLGTVNAMSIE